MDEVLIRLDPEESFLYIPGKDHRLNGEIRTLSIVIPVYNEMHTILSILRRVERVKLIHDIRKEIILVNDCSQDGTEAYIQEYLSLHPDAGIRYYAHTVNQGKGAAIHTGIQMATGDCLIVQDADLEYDPREYNVLLKPMIEGHADVVYGSRFVGGRARRVLFFWHSVGNKLLTFLSNMFTGLNLTDMETCYKLFHMDILRGLSLKEKRFGFEPEVTARIARIPGIRIYEVGISYYGRTFQDGKKIGVKDGFRALYCIVKYKFIKNGPGYHTNTGRGVRRSHDLAASQRGGAAKSVDV